MVLLVALLATTAGCGAWGRPPEEKSPTTVAGDSAPVTQEVTMLPEIPSINPVFVYPTDAAPTQLADALQAATPNAEILTGAPDPAASTFTGFATLPARAIAIPDPNNSKQLPTKKIEHSYGVAKDETPHQISMDNQKFFDGKHYQAVAYDNITQEKVLYLTFDCGYENGNTAKILDVLREKQVPAAFFCTVDEMKGAPEIVARMIREGHIVGNHSVTHPSFAQISRTQMAQEVLASDNYLRTNFGYSAPFFRFPKGEYTESALEAVASLGFSSIFWSAAYSDWDVTTQRGAQYAVDTVTSRLHPGAILLLHSVSADNAAGMAAIIDKAQTMGYHFRDLTQLPLFHP
jgi:peptidoglycan-N-acetylmuramic acid deacetylase